MKKIYFVIFLLVAFISTSAVAEVVTTKRKVAPKQPEPVAVQQTTASSKLASNMMTCTPYTETLDSSFIGLLFNFKIQIKGWIDNKCEVDFTAEPTAGFRSFYQYADNYEKNNEGGSYATSYGIVEHIYIAKAKCAFTKEQLAAVGDSILEEEKRKNGGKMLKNPEDIDISGLYDMSPNDEALMDMVFRQGACTIQNGQNSSMLLNGFKFLGF